MNIKFNLESNPTDGFYALYASLRFFKEYKTQINKNTDAISVPAAECYCMLEDLKAQHPKEYAEAESEYNSVYNFIGGVFCKDCSNEDPVAIFEVADFTTEIVGRYNSKNNFFYIQRGDGFIHKYESDRVIKFKTLFN